MLRLLLADRVKAPGNSFLAPLVPALSRQYDVRLVSLAPGDALAAAIADADIVWLEWCWDHAVWVTNTDVLGDRPCLVRLHSIEALQSDFPARVNWPRVQRLILVGQDIADVLAQRFPEVHAKIPVSIIPNGIDLDRFKPGMPDRYRVGWVGHLEPKKNPMLLLQIAHGLHCVDQRYSVHVAGAFTDLRTFRYLQRMISALGLEGVIHFHGEVADMPTWYADKGVLLSTTMYESFGMNIGEAMATGAFPVVHDFPGSELLWPPECLFATINEAIALIRSAQPGLYRDWVERRYSLRRQATAVLALLDQISAGPAFHTSQAA